MSTTAYTIDLTTEDYRYMRRPIIEYTPSGCYSEQWSITQGDYTTSTGSYYYFYNTVSDFSTRRTLMAEGSRTYTFSGYLTDAANTAFQERSVTLTFEDDCRTTTINSMSITMDRYEWRVNKTDSKFFTPFTDTTEQDKY